MDEYKENNGTPEEETPSDAKEVEEELQTTLFDGEEECAEPSVESEAVESADTADESEPAESADTADESEPAESAESSDEGEPAESADTADESEAAESADTADESEAAEIAETGSAEDEDDDMTIAPEKPKKPEQETAPEEPEGEGDDGIGFACALCENVIGAVGADGFHGGVRPDNIVYSGGRVMLGSRLEHGVGEFTPQELEYMAPELFWDGIRDCSADVYSIGLVMYAIYNRGRMPFWPENEDATPNLRAAALQKRMSNAELPPPVDAGRELSEIILRALSYSAEERWHDASELHDTLSALELSSGKADISSVIAETAERSASPISEREGSERKQDKKVRKAAQKEAEEEPLPKRRVRKNRNRLARIIVYTILLISLAALVLLLRECGELSTPKATPAPAVTPTAVDPDAVKIIDGNQSGTALPVSQATPAPTPEATAEPAPEATPEPVITYVAFRENVGWDGAVARCQEMGGELAMPATYDEFIAVTDAANELDLTYVWLGAHRDNGNWVNMKGDVITGFFAWGDGEPSVTDNGVPEDYFMLWNMNDRWCGNDSRLNPLEGFWGSYANRIGFVCKMTSYPEAETSETSGNVG